MAIPKYQKAAVIQDGQTLNVENIPVPKLTNENEFLVIKVKRSSHSLNL
jgi:hypothetical protein